MKNKMKTKAKIHFYFHFRFCFDFYFYFRFHLDFWFLVLFFYFFYFSVFIFKFYYGTCRPPYTSIQFSQITCNILVLHLVFYQGFRGTMALYQMGQLIQLFLSIYIRLEVFTSGIDTNVNYCCYYAPAVSFFFFFFFLTGHHQGNQ